MDNPVEREVCAPGLAFLRHPGRRPEGIHDVGAQYNRGKSLWLSRGNRKSTNICLLKTPFLDKPLELSILSQNRDIYISLESYSQGESNGTIGVGRGWVSVVNVKQYQNLPPLCWKRYWWWTALKRLYSEAPPHAWTPSPQFCTDSGYVWSVLEVFGWVSLVGLPGFEVFSLWMGLCL